MPRIRRHPIDFVRALWHQPLWVKVWVTWLAVVNVAGLAFVDEAAGRYTVIAFAAAFALIMGLHAIDGYTRLLGLGHILPWAPLVVYLGLELQQLSGAVHTWALLVLVTNAISLLIDFIDVGRYVRGDRSRFEPD